MMRKFVPVCIFFAALVFVSVPEGRCFSSIRSEGLGGAGILSCRIQFRIVSS